MTNPNCHGSNVALQLTEEPKQGRNRMHLDLYTPDQKGEVAPPLR